MTLLLDRGAKTDNKDRDNRTVLHLVALRGHESTTKLLLRREVGKTLLYASDGEGRTPLHFAADKMHECVAQVLATQMTTSPSVDPRDKPGHTPLHYATCWGFYHMPSCVVDPTWRGGGCSAGASSGMSMRAAKVLKVLPSTAAEDDDSTEERCYNRVVRVLLDNGAQVDAVDSFGYTTLHLAVHEEQESEVRLLLKHGHCNPSP